MSQSSSRAHRRQTARGGAPPPKGRLPRAYIYVAIGIILVAVVVGLKAPDIVQQHETALAYATPTPGPNASSTPVQLINDVPVGAAAFANPIKANPHNGAPVDGITCIATEQTMLHIHAHLALFIDGKQLQVPAGIGIAPVPPAGCLYWIHTHDTSGIIHIEAPQLNPPAGGPYTLGMLFDIWGQPLTPDDIAGKTGPVTAYVNGARWNGNLRDIPLVAHQQVTLEVGKSVPPPNYAFPPGL